MIVSENKSWFSIALAGVLALLPGTPVIAQGTIIFFNPPQPIPVVHAVFPPATYDFDVDGDGAPDYHFNLADGFGVSVEPLGNNRQIALPAIPPDLGSDLDPLAASFQIGSSLAPTYSWVDRNSPNLAGRSLISACFDIGGNFTCTGLFHGQTAYMGMEFWHNGSTVYGWALIENPAGTAGGFIRQWAYESQSGVPIFAGAGVPEPSTVALFLISGAGICLLRRR